MDKAQKHARRLGLIGLCIVAPLGITTGQLWLSRSFDLWSWWTGASDIIAIAAGIAIGLVGIALLQLPRSQRFAFGFLYAVFGSGALFVWTIMFACAAFGGCL